MILHKKPRKFSAYQERQTGRIYFLKNIKKILVKQVWAII